MSNLFLGVQWRQLQHSDNKISATDPHTPRFTPWIITNQEAVPFFADLPRPITLAFSTDQRYCTGWRDITKHISHPCPDNAMVAPAYDTCIACKKRTGFNPAFYHSSTISPQQEQLNTTPHTLYLAYFSAELIKVGISQQRRGLGRLLEQGARSALVLDIFPNAGSARHYEAAIAKLPGIKETVSTNAKTAALAHEYTTEIAQQQLQQALSRIQAALGATFVPTFHDFSASHHAQTSYDLTDYTPPSILSGVPLSAFGSQLLTTYHGSTLLMSTSQFTGYPVTITFAESADLSLTPKQIGLF